MVETDGTEAPVEAMAAKSSTRGAALALLGVWVHTEATRFEWLMIPNALIVLLTIMICLNAVSGDRLHGKATFPRAPAGEVTIVAAMGLLMATTRFWVWAIDRTTILLSDPIGAYKRRRKAIALWWEREGEETAKWAAEQKAKKEAKMEAKKKHG